MAARAAVHAVLQAALESDPNDTGGPMQVPNTVDLVMLNEKMFKIWRVVLQKSLGPPIEERSGWRQGEVADSADGCGGEALQARWEVPRGAEARPPEHLVNYPDKEIRVEV